MTLLCPQALTPPGLEEIASFWCCFFMFTIEFSAKEVSCGVAAYEVLQKWLLKFYRCLGPTLPLRTTKILNEYWKISFESLESYKGSEEWQTQESREKKNSREMNLAFEASCVLRPIFHSKVVAEKLWHWAEILEDPWVSGGQKLESGTAKEGEMLMNTTGFVVVTTKDYTQ